jgi:tripartite-type tricarboxylate transporter receptor subunit TctC
MKKWIAMLLVCSLLPVFASGCGGSSDKNKAKPAQFPAGPVTLIIPYAAGGAADLMARAMEASLAKKLGQPVIVVNKPGGSGGVAMIETLKAKPDGHTLVAASTGPGSITPILNKAGYTNENFVPVAQILNIPLGLAVPNDSPLQSVSEFFEYAAKNPHKIKVGTPGATLSQHITIAQLAEERNLKMNLVPFNGGAESVTALLGGNVDAVFNVLTELTPHVKSGKFRLLGVTSAVRSPFVPETPTFKEQGLDVVRGVWYSLLAPKGTPADAVKRLETAVRDTLAEPEIKNTFEKISLPLEFLSGEEFAKKWAREYEANTKTLKK